MEEKRRPDQRNMDALRHLQTGLAGAAAVLISGILVLFERYLLGAFCLLIGVGIIVVLVAVEMRPRKP